MNKYDLTLEKITTIRDMLPSSITLHIQFDGNGDLTFFPVKNTFFEVKKNGEENKTN